MSYFLVQGQQSMALDLRRNQAYFEALQQVITPDSIVLDLGAGLGINGSLAAQLGAKKVYLVEPEDIITVASEIVRANGFTNIISLQGKIEEVNIPEQVDVIISVFTGNFLLQEDLLPSLFYARDKYLKPGGVMIPQAALMEAVPVSAPEVYQKNISCWSESHLGIDPHPARNYVSNSIYFYEKELNQAKYLAEPAKLLAMDFYFSQSTDCQVEVKSKITESGLCHGWAGWFAMQLGDKWLSTAPHEPPLHWSAAFLPLDPPVEVAAGEEVTLKLQRPPYGEWSWQVKSNKAQQQHSTFLAVPMTLKSIKKTALPYRPQLSNKGKAALYVLSQSNGTLSVEQLSTQIVKRFPELFADSRKALNFVRSLICSFS